MVFWRQMLAMHTSVFCYYQDQHKKLDISSLSRRGYQVSLTIWSVSWSKRYSVPLIIPAIPAPFGPKKSSVICSSWKIYFQLIGKLSYSAVAVLPAPLLYRPLQRQHILGILIEKNLEKEVYLSQEARKELAG